MKLQLKAGSTSNILQVFIRDSSSTTGAGLTGLVFNSASLTAYYHKDIDTTATSISLVTMTVGTFTSGGFKEIDATNMPGWYQFCPPDASLSTGKNLGFHLKGATNMAPLPIEVQLVSYDPYDTVRMGLTSLPNAAAESAGGLYTRGTGAGQISQPANGVIDTNTKTWNSLSTVALPLVPTTAGRTLDVSAGGEAGIDWANIGSPTTSNALTGTTIASTQKVDIDTIKTNPVVNAGTITFPTGATIASTSNITTVGAVSGNVAGSVNSVVSRVTANADQLAGQTVTAAASVIFPSSVASPTNITAGTITTATNLTNAPTNGDFTATMKASITTAATASTPTVAAVTGNVGGNVVGSVGSVTARVTANADQLAGQTITAASGVTFPATVASPTNITTVATVTNLTNAPTNGDLTATMKASVTTAATAATPTAASVTGNVGGNVTGSVGSVVGLTASNLDVTVSSRLATAGYTAPNNSGITAIKTVTDKLDTTLVLDGSVYQYTANALENAPSGGGGITVQEIVDGVWEADLPTYQTFPSSTAEMLAQIGLQGGGLTNSGQAGFDSVSSTLGIIQSKTDNLPANPAAVSDIPTATQNADALLNRDMSAVSDTNSRSPLNALRTLRNKSSVSANVLTVTKENDVSVAFVAAVTTDAAALPIIGVDPT